MSAQPHLAPRPRVRRPRAPQLRLAPRPVPGVAGNGAFIAVVAGLILAGMAALLVLNTSLAQGAFELQRLQTQQGELQVSEQALQQQVQAAQSPVALKKRADELGMVPVTVPAFLRLSDGAVLGDPTPARRAVRPTTVHHRKPRTTDAAVPLTAGTDAAVPDRAVPAVNGDEAAEQQARPGGRAVSGDEAAEQQARPGGRAVSGDEAAEAEAAPTRSDAATPATPASGGHRRGDGAEHRSNSDNRDGNGGNG